MGPLSTRNSRHLATPVQSGGRLTSGAMHLMAHQNERQCPPPSLSAARWLHASPPAKPTLTVEVGTVVQAAVDAGLGPNTKKGRSDHAAWRQRDSTAAVQALVGYRKIAAAAKTAPLPSTRPAPATPSAEPQYPSSWTAPASQAQSKGVRRDSAGQPSVVRAAQANGFRTRPSCSVHGGW